MCTQDLRILLRLHRKSAKLISALIKTHEKRCLIERTVVNEFEANNYERTGNTFARIKESLYLAAEAKGIESELSLKRMEIEQMWNRLNYMP